MDPNTIAVERGDKITLVTKTAVLICQVVVVRERSCQPQGEDANASGSVATIEVAVDSAIEVGDGS